MSFSIFRRFHNDFFSWRRGEDALHAADPRETPDINSLLPCHRHLGEGELQLQVSKAASVCFVFYHSCKNTLSFHERQDLLQSFHLKTFAFSSLKLWFFLYFFFLFTFWNVLTYSVSYKLHIWKLHSSLCFERAPNSQMTTSSVSYIDLQQITKVILKPENSLLPFLQEASTSFQSNTMSMLLTKASYSITMSCLFQIEDPKR